MKQKKTKQANRWHVHVCLLFAGLNLAWASLRAAEDRVYYEVDDYLDVEKIDAHFHIRTVDSSFVAEAAKEGFRFLNVAVHVSDPVAFRQRHQAAYAQKKAHPNRVEVMVAFELRGWDDPDWVERTIQYLGQAKERGALGVKVWKDIGMVFRDHENQLVMIDHPQFDPVFDFMEREGMRLMGHLGEPRNCWLPLEEMTVKNDRRYFQNNPQYHMYLHPEMPSYEEQLAARDRMLGKHPNLPFLGAHFGSLEWSVDALARFLEEHPSAVVDTAARMGQLEYQSQRDWKKVRDFMLKYQDRILYGTDGGVQAPGQAASALIQMQKRWQSDWIYLASREEQSVPELDLPVKGLHLPRSVLDKIYHGNARRLFPTAWTE